MAVLEELPPDVVRRAIETQTCPWCGAGPFLVLAGHTSRRHGVNRLELRERARLLAGESVCDPEHSRRCADIQMASGRRPPGTKPGGRRHLNTAAREAQRAKSLRAGEAPEETRTRMTWVQSHRTYPPPPPEALRPCGTYAAYKRGCRCPACRAANAEFYRGYRQRRRLRAQS